MRLVKENIEFERSENPQRDLRVGKYSKEPSYEDFIDKIEYDYKEIKRGEHKLYKYASPSWFFFSIDSKEFGVNTGKFSFTLKNNELTGKPELLLWDIGDRADNIATIVRRLDWDSDINALIEEEGKEAAELLQLRSPGMYIGESIDFERGGSKKNILHRVIGDLPGKIMKEETRFGKTFFVYILNKDGKYDVIGFFMESPGGYTRKGGYKTFYYNPQDYKVSNYNHKLVPLNKWERARIQKYLPNISSALGLNAYFGERVNEAEHFQRGVDPKYSLNVGAINSIINAWDKVQHSQGMGSMNLNKDESNSPFYLRIWISYMPDMPQNARDFVYKYFGKNFFIRDYLKGSNIYFEIKPEYEELFIGAWNKMYPEYPITPLNEEFNFQRGQIDPMVGMGVGMVNQLREGFKRLDGNRSLGRFSLMDELDPTRYRGAKMAILLRNYVSPAEALRIIQKFLGTLEPFSDYFDEGDYVVLAVKSQWRDIVRKAYNQALGLRESIDFERGKDPKDSMGLGRIRKIKEIEKWVNPNDSNRHYYEPIKDIDYEGCIVVIYKSIDTHPLSPEPAEYSAVFMYPNGMIMDTGEFRENAVVAWEDAKKKIDREKTAIETGYWEAAGLDSPDYFNPISESLEFERGIDPKEALGIGSVQHIVDAWRRLEQVVGVRSVDLRKYPHQRGRLKIQVWIVNWGDNKRVMEFVDENFGQKYFSNVNNQLNYIWYTIKPQYENLFRRAFDKMYRHTLEEGLEFERGKDPKEIMGIGNHLVRTAKKYNIDFKKAKEIVDTLQMFFPSDISEEEFEMNAYQITHDISREDLQEYGLQPEDRNFYNIKWADLNPIKSWELFKAARKDAGITESIEFERGKDPKEAIGLGKEGIWKHKILPHLSYDPEEFDLFDLDYYMGYPIAILRQIDLDDNDFPYVAIGVIDDLGENINVFTSIFGSSPGPVLNYVRGKMADYIGSFQEVDESVNFEKNNNPQKSLGIGKYRPQEFTFQDYEGESHTVRVQDNCFNLFGMKVCLEFKEHEDPGIMKGERYAYVYVDGQKSDMNVFFLTPSEYEFFVPQKPLIQKNEGSRKEYHSDPNPENWSKTKSAYGYPLVDKGDKKKLKEMKEKYGYWHVSSMSYTRTNKNPFAAVAEMIAFTY